MPLARPCRLTSCCPACQGSGALRRAPLCLEPPEWYNFLVVFFGTSVFQEVVSKARFEDQEVSCEVPPEGELFSSEVEE